MIYPKAISIHGTVAFKDHMLYSYYDSSPTYDFVATGRCSVEVAITPRVHWVTTRVYYDRYSYYTRNTESTVDYSFQQTLDQEQISIHSLK